jgi:hypothetical protein
VDDFDLLEDGGSVVGDEDFSLGVLDLGKEIPFCPFLLVLGLF